MKKLLLSTLVLGTWTVAALAGPVPVAPEETAMPAIADKVAVPAAAATPALAVPGAAGTTAEAAVVEQLRRLELPSLEGLTLESDFSAFMAPGVPEDVRRLAFRKGYELRRAASALAAAAPGAENYTTPF